MNYHLLAHAASVAAGASLVQLAAVSDPKFSRSNNSFQIPKNHWIYGMYAGGLDLTQARIQTGSLRNKGFPQVRPLEAVALPPDEAAVMDLRDYPMMLKQEEDYRVDVVHSNAGAQNVAVLTAVYDQATANLNVNVGDVRWLRFTASVTAVALGWSNLGSIAFDDVLEGGTYQVYGMEAQGANIIAARLSFNNHNYRPGCLGQALLGSRHKDLFRMGMGLWGTFTTYSLPQIETLESAAGASSIVGFMLVGKN